MQAASTAFWLISCSGERSTARSSGFSRAKKWKELDVIMQLKEFKVSCPVRN